MAKVSSKSVITNNQAQVETKAAETQKKSIALIMNELLDQNGIRARINDLLGSRAAQFTGSLVSLVNADENMQQVFREAPMTIIQAGLRAAVYDLPVDPGLGYAYIVPFNNKKNHRREAVFIMGYKGMYQLAMRTGVYRKLNVVDIREGELRSFNRLTEDIELEFYANEEQRASKPIVGWCGFFRLINGMEKYVYMTVPEIKEHEKKHRKGEYMGKGWRDDFDAMCAKTVMRRLIGKWGIMSIDYQRADAKTVAAAEAIAKGQFDDEDLMDPAPIEIPQTTTTAEGRKVDLTTGELLDKQMAAEGVPVIPFDDPPKAKQGD